MIKEGKLRKYNKGGFCFIEYVFHDIFGEF